MFRRMLIGFLVVSASLCRLASGAIALDNFEEGELSMNLATPSTVAINQTGLSTSNVLGGARVGDFQLISGASASLTVEPGSESLDDGFLRLTTGVDSTARVNLTLIDEPGGYDLLAHGTAIEVYMDVAPSVPDTFMQFTDTSGRTRQRAINYQGPGVYRWGVPQASAQFDPHAVSLVTWRGTIWSSSELQVASIVLVPEPSSLAALLGCSALLLRQRKQVR